MEKFRRIIGKINQLFQIINYYENEYTKNIKIHIQIKDISKKVFQLLI